MKIIVIDNYDSFTYNLVHAIKKITGGPVTVARNDEISLAGLEEYDKIVYHRAREFQRKQDCCCPSSASLPRVKACWGFALATRPSERYLELNLLNMNRVLHGIATPVNTTSRNHSFV
jgi:anthranilate synthase component II